MTYDEALTAMLGLIGREVVVSILLPGNPTVPVLASMSGVLQSGEDFARLGEALGLSSFATDSIRFTFQNRSLIDNGFFMDRSRFINAHWDKEEPIPTLVINLTHNVVMRNVDKKAEWRPPRLDRWPSKRDPHPSRRKLTVTVCNPYRLCTH